MIKFMILLLLRLLLFLFGGGNQFEINEIQRPEVFDAASGMELLLKERTRVYELLGQDAERFEIVENAPEYSLAKDQYVLNEEIPVYNVTLYFQQTVEGEEYLCEIDYNIYPEEADDIEALWDWIYSQEQILEAYFEGGPDHVYGDEIGSDLSDQVSDIMSGSGCFETTYEWNSDVESELYQYYLLSYRFYVKIQKDLVVIRLHTNESYSLD